VSGGGSAERGVGPPPQDRTGNVPVRDRVRPDCPVFVPEDLLAEIALDLGRARLVAQQLGDELLLYLIDVAAFAARQKEFRLQLACAVRAGEEGAALLSLPTV
jgi:hypothetical protein